MAEFDMSAALAGAAVAELQRQSREWSAATMTRSWHLTKLGVGFVNQAREFLTRHGYDSYYPKTYRRRAIAKKKLSKDQRKNAHLFKQYKSEPLFRGYLFVHVDVVKDRWHGTFREAG